MAEIILAIWCAILVAATFAANVVKAGDTRRRAEEIDRRNLRNAAIGYREARQR